MQHFLDVGGSQMPSDHSKDGVELSVRSTRGDLDRIIEHTLRETAQYLEGGLRLVRVLALFDHVFRTITGVDDDRVRIGQIVEERQHLFADDDFDHTDIFFAIGIRNQVAHRVDGLQPSAVEIDRATKHLIRAMKVVYPNDVVNSFRIPRSLDERVVRTIEQHLPRSVPERTAGLPYYQQVAGAVGSRAKYVIGVLTWLLCFAVLCFCIFQAARYSDGFFDAMVRPAPAKQNRESERFRDSWPFVNHPDADGMPSTISPPRPKNWWEERPRESDVGGAGTP